MIAIVDYGVGNLFSLSSSLKALGLETEITGDAARLQAADRIILPGVGAFGDAKAKLDATGLVDILRAEAEKKHKAEPKPESSEPGVNKDDSREGLRAYARGRAYMPDRFGGVTPYVDPNIAMKAEAEAAAKAKKSSKKNKEEK